LTQFNDELKTLHILKTLHLYVHRKEPGSLSTIHFASDHIINDAHEVSIYASTDLCSYASDEISTCAIMRHRKSVPYKLFATTLPENVVHSVDPTLRTYRFWYTG